MVAVLGFDSAAFLTVQFCPSGPSISNSVPPRLLIVSAHSVQIWRVASVVAEMELEGLSASGSSAMMRSLVV